MKTITQTRNYCDNIRTRLYFNIETFRLYWLHQSTQQTQINLKRILQQAHRMAKISPSSATRWVVSTRVRDKGGGGGGEGCMSEREGGGG